MRELSKQEKQVAREVLKRGILNRHVEWQNEVKELLESPVKDGENAFDKSMEITKMARDFFKEAMALEDYYRNSLLIIGLANLYSHHYLTIEDFDGFDEELVKIILSFVRLDL